MFIGSSGTRDVILNTFNVDDPVASEESRGIKKVTSGTPGTLSGEVPARSFVRTNLNFRIVKEGTSSEDGTDTKEENQVIGKLDSFFLEDTSVGVEPREVVVFSHVHIDVGREGN